jgi:predicted nucleotidyltransferase
MDYARPIEVVVPGAQGRVLAVLARNEVELTMRTVAQLAETSVGQTSLVVGRLVELGLVARRDVGTASLIRLERRNEAARAVLAIADLRQHVIRRLRAEAAKIKPRPASLVVFGSFARGEARAASDLDVLAVQAHEVHWNNDEWIGALGHWQETAHQIAGNPVNLIELDLEELPKAAPEGSVWRAIANESLVLTGVSLVEREGCLVLEHRARRQSA